MPNNNYMWTTTHNMLTVAQSSEHIQKLLVLGDLRGVHCEFKEKIPDCKIRVLKFPELRPEHWGLAETSGTHSVCVCTVYPNVKLSYQHTTTVW